MFIRYAKKLELRTTIYLNVGALNNHQYNTLFVTSSFLVITGTWLSNLFFLLHSIAADHWTTALILFVVAKKRDEEILTFLSSNSEKNICSSFAELQNVESPACDA